MRNSLKETLPLENAVPQITFYWHGGEPLPSGWDFFRKALSFERKHAGEKIAHNSIQTNGTLIDEEWTQFFKVNQFLVGISLDGHEDIHDRYRMDKGGSPTFNKVMKGLEYLKKAGVEFNTLSTINKASEGRGLEIYEFLKAAGSHYMQFMPVLEHATESVRSAGSI